MPVAREVLKTEHLNLEPVGEGRAESLFRAAIDSRPELLPWMPWARDPTLEGARAQTITSERDWNDDSEFHFCVIDKHAGQVLGVAGLNRDGDGSAELHYWIRTDHSGRGLATEACRTLIAWAPSALGVQRLTLWAGRDNAASRRVATKLGFEHVGPLAWRPDGGLGAFDAESYVLKLPAASDPLAHSPTLRG
ncbi:MAG TPA: GNAT family N-acetyltransferase [Candidatus Dormibacteraeota bacterium]